MPICTSLLGVSCQRALVLLLGEMRHSPSTICNNRFRLTRRPARARIAALVAALAIPLSAASEGPQCGLVERVMREVSAVRGLIPKSEVPCAIAGRGQIREFLRQHISEKLPPKKLEMEQVTFRAVGIVPDDYDYEHGVIEFYVSQIGGYYDPDTKRLVMAEWIPASVQEGVVRHELTHALQDQLYGLDQFLDPKGDNGDQLLAFASLVEGDATAVMSDIDRMQRAQPPLAKSRSVTMGQGGHTGPIAAPTSPAHFPQALESIILFPYTHGIQFVHALLRSGGYAAVDAAFASPPRSSHEILKPDDYISRRFRAENPSPEELGAGAQGASVLYTDVLGEFAIRAILEAGGIPKPQALKSSQGWRGDRIGVLAPRGGEQLVVWKSAWASEADAQEFASAYRTMVRARYGIAIGEQRTKLSPLKAAALTTHEREVLAQFWVSRGPRT